MLGRPAPVVDEVGSRGRAGPVACHDQRSGCLEVAQPWRCRGSCRTCQRMLRDRLAGIPGWASCGREGLCPGRRTRRITTSAGLRRRREPCRVRPAGLVGEAPSAGHLNRVREIAQWRAALTRGAGGPDQAIPEPVALHLPRAPPGGCGPRRYVYEGFLLGAVDARGEPCVIVSSKWPGWRLRHRVLHSRSRGHRGGCPDSWRECERRANTACATRSGAVALVPEHRTPARAGPRWWILVCDRPRGPAPSWLPASWRCTCKHLAACKIACFCKSCGPRGASSCRQTRSSTRQRPHSFQELGGLIEGVVSVREATLACSPPRVPAEICRCRRWRLSAAATASGRAASFRLTSTADRPGRGEAVLPGNATARRQAASGRNVLRNRRDRGSQTVCRHAPCLRELAGRDTVGLILARPFGCVRVVATRGRN
jgi:hypothetical protein